MSDAFDKVIYHGRVMDKKTRAFVMACEEALGYELTIVQGSYSGGAVAQSGGTHDGGGVLDLAPWDWENKLRVIKNHGGFGWYRPTIAGLWGAHIHFGIRNHGRLDPSAARQQVAYDNRRDGLVSNRVDNSYRPATPRVFVYPVKKEIIVPKPTRVSKARDKIVEAHHTMGQAQSLLKKTPATREVVKDQLKRVRGVRREMKDILDVLPPR